MATGKVRPPGPHPQVSSIARGSSTLVQALIADGLLDELHLFVYPVTRGTGPRLFPDNPPTNWTLAHSTTYDNGVLYLVYQAST